MENLSSLHAAFMEQQDPTDVADPMDFVAWLYEEGHATFASEDELRPVFRFLGVVEDDGLLREARELGYLDDGRTLDDDL